MKPKKKYCLYFLLSFFSGFLSFSQNKKVDSLLILLKKEKNDTALLKQLNVIAWEYLISGNYNTSLLFSDSTLNFGNQLLKNVADPKVKQSIQKNISGAYNTKGADYFYQSDFPSSLQNYEASLKIRESFCSAGCSVKDKTSISGTHVNMGNVYFYQGKYPEALKSYFAALKIREEIKDEKGIGNCYTGIGNVYTNQGNYPEAIKNYNYAIKVAEKLGNKTELARSHNNLGVVYGYQGNYKEAIKQYQTSLKISETLVMANGEIGDKEGMADNYNNIAMIYTEERNYNNALENYYKALQIFEASDNKIGLAQLYGNIGIVYSEQKKYQEAEKYFLKSISVSKEIGNREALRFYYRNLTSLDSAKGDFKSAYENHKEYIFYRDSLDNVETRKKTVESQMTYDFEKRELAAKAVQEKKDVIAKEELKHKEQQRNYLIIGFVLLAILALFIFRSYRQKQRANIIITAQKAEVEEKSKIIEEKNKDILDSINYAKRIQSAILANEDDIKKYYPDSFLLYIPKDIVAGDFYFFEATKTHVFYAAADCTGHGVPGALVSVVCSNALTRCIKEFELNDPGEILDKTRNIVLDTFKKSGQDIKDGMDISLFVKNIKNNTYKWAGANNPLWYISNGVINEITANKQPVGLSDDSKPFTSHNLPLKSGEIVFLFTDGYPDQFGGPKGKKFKYKQLKELLAAHSDNLSESKQVLVDQFVIWKGELEQVDDVCIIGIRV